MSQDDGGRECREAVERRMEQLYQYLDGALTPEDLEAVRAHVSECPDCHHQQELEMLIRTAVRRSCQEKAPEQLRATIMTRISQVSSSRGTTTHVSTTGTWG